MTTGLIYDDRFLEHDTAEAHPECADRLRAITAYLKEKGLWDRMTLLPFEAADERAVHGVHDEFYVQRLREACAEGVSYIDSPDSNICPASMQIALLAVGGILSAVDAVMAGQVDNAFCAMRPPGHHAERDRSMGFCLFNNIAIAAEYLIREHHIARVAIVDFDVHHGNGTQHTFESRNDVLFISLHEDPQWLYPGTGFAEETGMGPGAGLTINIPFQPNCGDGEYIEAFEEKVLPALDAFAPQVLLVSAGFDASVSDSIAHQQVSTDGFTYMAEKLCEAAGRYCDGRVIATLEGGYDLESLAKGVAAWIEVWLKSSAA